jgi:hypothetical protein
LGTTAIVLRLEPWQAVRSSANRRADAGTRRRGDAETLPYRPLFWCCEHSNQAADDVVIKMVQFLEVIFAQILAAKREIEPDARLLGFAFCIAQFTNKMRFVPALAPRFTDIGAN